ncbi:MAG: leucine-rich repeat domain-containing protein [Dehalococcoidia bacterium]|nr:leucine-rich repeat domain-containing protein [Dehalococcoidia bacterium]
MAVLNETQIQNKYFGEIGGFPSSKIIHELNEYNGEEQACIACTQLNGEEVKIIFSDVKSYTERDKKRILNEWLAFLRANTKALKALHFNSRVSQALFDAACCQENLEELRFKWGVYSELSALQKLNKLKFLYVGQGSSVQEIAVLGQLKNLVVLHVEAFKKIDDYSPLITLNNLEQLVITGPILGTTPIRDLEFLREMKNLRSISLSNVTIKRKYTPNELDNLRVAVPQLHDVNNCIFGR